MPESEGPSRDRVAVVTGGRGGLGVAIAGELERSGRFAAVLAPGRDVLDVARPESVSAFFSQLGRLDLLVNNAGVTRDRAFAGLSEADWDAVIATNLRGAFLCARAALKQMFRQAEGAHIVNIGSFSALGPPAGQVAYASAKAGLIGLTQSLAAEMGLRGVRVNCVLPGFLEGTGMTEGLDVETIDRQRARHVLGRFNTPAEAARFVAFLDTMAAVSGQVFQLDSRIRRWT